jgi:hypothetical protein
MGRAFWEGFAIALAIEFSIAAIVLIVVTR